MSSPQKKTEYKYKCTNIYGKHICMEHYLKKKKKLQSCYCISICPL